MWEGLSVKQIRTLFTEPFWDRFLSFLIQTDREEDYFWDYKADFPVSKTIPKLKREEVYHEVLKDFTGFANAESGLLIYGITNKPRSLKGIGDPELCIQWILDLLKHRIDSSFRVVPLIVPIHKDNEVINCVIFIIPQTPNPIGIKHPKTHNLIFYQREGTRTIALTEVSHITHLFSEKSKINQNLFPILNIVQKIINLPITGITETLNTQYSNNEPLFEKDRIISNICPVRFPIKVWEGDIYLESGSYIDRRKAPPFIIKEGKIFTLISPKKLEIYDSIVNSKTVKKLNSKEFLETYPRYFVELINNWIKSILFNKGLFQDKRTKAFYFASHSDMVEYWIPKKRRVSRNVVKFYPKKDKPSEINYVFNRAANFYTQIIEKQPFLIICPRLFFTKDGFKPETGQRTKRLIESWSKDPKKFYNNNQRNNVLFWHQFIKMGPTQYTFDSRTLHPRINGLKSRRIQKLLKLLNIGRLIEFQVNWVPNSDSVETQFDEEEFYRRFSLPTE